MHTVSLEISTLFSQYLAEQIGCRSLGRRNDTTALVCVRREQALRMKSDIQGTYWGEKNLWGKRDAAGEGRKNCQTTMQAVTLKEGQPGSSQEEVCWKWARWWLRWPRWYTVHPRGGEEVRLPPRTQSSKTLTDFSGGAEDRNLFAQGRGHQSGKIPHARATKLCGAAGCWACELQSN